MARRRYTKLPEINLKELEKAKEENFRERPEFQDRYVEWLKKQAISSGVQHKDP